MNLIWLLVINLANSLINMNVVKYVKNEQNGVLYIVYKENPSHVFNKSSLSLVYL